MREEPPEPEFVVGEVIHAYGSSGILGDIVARDEEEESVDVVWRKCYSTESIYDEMLCKAEDQTPPEKHVLVVTRHPDFGNEYAEFGGDVQLVTLDYGANFDSTPNNQEQMDEWAEGARSEVSNLPESHLARVFVETAIAELAENAGLKVPA